MPEIHERQQTVRAGPARKTSSAGRLQNAGRQNAGLQNAGRQNAGLQNAGLQNVSVALIDAPVIVGLPAR